MTTFTAVADPNHTPPRVLLEFDLEDPEAIITQSEIRRDGVLVRSQFQSGFDYGVAEDYEAPYGELASYSVTGEYIPPNSGTEWTEDWANLTAWSGSTGLYSVAGGKAIPSVAGAEIYRTTSGILQRASVIDPSYVTVQILGTLGAVPDAVLATIQVDSKITVTGDNAAQQTAGSGSFTATIFNGSLSVAATNGSWTLVTSMAGIPDTIKVIGLESNFTQTSNVAVSPNATGFFAGTLMSNSYAVDTAGNSWFNTTDFDIFSSTSSSSIKKYSPTGALLATIGSNANDLICDANDNLYFYNVTGVIKKHSPSGSFLMNIGTGMAGLAIDSAGNLCSKTSGTSTFKKFDTTTGTEIDSFTLTGGTNCTVRYVDTSGNIWTTDNSAQAVKKFSSTGTLLLTIPYPTYGGGSTNNIVGVTVTPSGQPYLVGSNVNSIYVYSAAGVLLGNIAVPGAVNTYRILGMRFAPNSTNKLFVGQYATGSGYGGLWGGLVTKYERSDPSIGSVTASFNGQTESFGLYTAETTLDVPEMWMIHPVSPSLSMPVDYGMPLQQGVFLQTQSDVVRASNATTHNLVGRQYPVVISSGNRSSETFTLTFFSKDRPSIEAFEALLEDQTPLLIRTPVGFGYDITDGWYSVGDLTISRSATFDMTVPARKFSLPVTAIESPVVEPGLSRTYGSLLFEAATYTNLPGLYPTYLDVLVGDYT